MVHNWQLCKKGDTPSNTIQLITDPWWSKSQFRSHAVCQKELAKIYDAKLDIYCSCRQARMYIQKRQGIYILVNHAIQGKHESDCHLFTEISGEINHVAPEGTFVPETIKSVCFHHQILDKDNETKELRKERKQSENTHNQPKLLSLLLQLLSDAFHHVYHPKYSVVSPLKALMQMKNTAKNVQFGQDKLSEFIFFGQKGEWIAKQILANTTESNWVGPGRPHCLIVELIHSIEQKGNRLIMDSRFYEYQHVIRPGNQKTSGPFLVISTLIKEDGTNIRHTACIKPVVSENILMPIDSNHERTFAQRCIELINNAYNPNQSFFQITKPITPKISIDNEVLLPDFILVKKLPNKRVVQRDIIEVFGSEHPTYLARKRNLLPKMQSAFKGDRLIIIHDSDELETSKYLANLIPHHADIN